MDLNKYFYTIIACYLICYVTCSEAEAKIKWSLQITDPKYNLKNIDLPDKSFRPFLPKTSWHCTFGETKKVTNNREERETKAIICNYSIKKNGKFTTYVSCSKNQRYGESKIDLMDEKKNLLFNILVFCTKEI